MGKSFKLIMDQCCLSSIKTGPLQNMLYPSGFHFRENADHLIMIDVLMQEEINRLESMKLSRSCKTMLS